MELKQQNFFEHAKVISNKIDLSLDAILFIMFTERKTKCTSFAIVESVIRKACNLYGKRAEIKLDELGIKDGRTIGKVIYAYIEEGLIKEETGDDISQFDNIYNKKDNTKLFKKYLLESQIKVALKICCFLISVSLLLVLFLNTTNKGVMIPVLLGILAYLYLLFIRKI